MKKGWRLYEIYSIGQHLTRIKQNKNQIIFKNRSTKKVWIKFRVKNKDRHLSISQFLLVFLLLALNR